MRKLTLFIFCILSTSAFAEVFVFIKSDEIVFESIQPLIENIKEIGFDGIILQTFSNGELIFPNDSIVSKYNYDLLDEIVYYSRREEIPIILSFDLLKVWDSFIPPFDLNHFYNKRKEWFCINNSGNSILDYSTEDLNIDGYYLSPLAPGLSDLYINTIKTILERYQIAGFLFLKLKIPDNNWYYDSYMRTEFYRKFYIDPIDVLSQELSEEWNDFPNIVTKNFLQKIIYSIDKNYNILIFDSNFEEYTIQNELNINNIPDSCWLYAKDYTPKNLADIINKRKDCPLLIIDNSRDILRIIGYKEMIKIVLNSN